MWNHIFTYCTAQHHKDAPLDTFLCRDCQTAVHKTDYDISLKPTAIRTDLQQTIRYDLVWIKTVRILEAPEEAIVAGNRARERIWFKWANRDILDAPSYIFG